jgi:8-hydroxy-5-deazaflavin:NADPH oxidoreductase
MKIGIIGAGMIGETLARRLAQLGHQTAIANSRGPETLRGLASEIGATAVTALEAARSGEIVVGHITGRPRARCRRWVSRALSEPAVLGPGRIGE